MASVLRGSALLCGLICGCTVAPQPSGKPGSNETTTDGNASNVDRGDITGHAGAAGAHKGAGGASSSTPHNRAGAAGTTQHTDEPAMGGGSSAGEGAGADPDPDPPDPIDPALVSCEVNATCTSKCGGSNEGAVTCGLLSTGVACEFEGFVGATAEVGCGERVVIGTACCGACGCVPVEVYFDGAQCWQGVPQCQLPSLNSRFFTPHPTTEPNPSFTPPGSFYLGTGGIGGANPVDSTAGTSAAGDGVGGVGGVSGVGGVGGTAGVFEVAGSSGSGGSSGSAGNCGGNGGSSGSGGKGGGSGSTASDGGDGGTGVTDAAAGESTIVPPATAEP